MTWITGTVKYVDLGPGFYGVIANDGTEYRPVNFPEQLKQEGKKISLLVQNFDEEMSMFMWGKTVKVRGFKTI